ncbi:MAG: PhoH family protein [Acidobacteria bacterium]|nr:MAG: PhoH family protein [Acidobacteriota bacterium]
MFVLDTSVILHDGQVLEQLEDNDIAVPITVLEELDGFKKGNNVLSQHAREFIRRLDALSEDPEHDLRDWLDLGDELGRLCVISEEADSDQLMLGLRGRSNDHRILGAALSMQAREPGRSVILISKDINLRVKARALGLVAEDYESTQVSDVEHLYSGMSVEQVGEDEVIDELYSEGSMPLSRLPQGDWPLNHHLILKGPSRSALAYRGRNGSIQLVRKVPAYGITPRNAEQVFALNAILDDEIPLVTLTGGAGTGKTLLALAGALERRRRYRQILLARPIVPLSNRDLGYLPGDVDSKISPYMQTLWANLSVIRGAFSDGHRDTQRLDEMLEHEKLQIAPLAYIRGRSLSRCLFIIDEAQNLTPHEIKTIITRAGEGTKVVFTGDIFQIDTPYLDAQSNGLSYLVDRMRGHALYAHVNLHKGERSELANLATELL